MVVLTVTRIVSFQTLPIYISCWLVFSKSFQKCPPQMGNVSIVFLSSLLLTCLSVFVFCRIPTMYQPLAFIIFVRYVFQSSSLDHKHHIIPALSNRTNRSTSLLENTTINSHVKNI